MSEAKSKLLNIENHMDYSLSFIIVGFLYRKPQLPWQILKKQLRI